MARFDDCTLDVSQKHDFLTFESGEDRGLVVSAPLKRGFIEVEHMTYFVHFPIFTTRRDLKIALRDKLKEGGFE